MITLQKPTTQSLVADAYRQLQGQESTTQGALDVMNSLPVGTTLLEHQGATAAYRQAYLAECELSTMLGQRAAILEGNDAAVAERIGAAYCMSGTPRMEPVMFSRLYRYLAGWCSVKLIPDNFLDSGEYIAECTAAIPTIDAEYRMVDPQALHRSASVIVLDLDIWGIPK